MTTSATNVFDTRPGFFGELWQYRGLLKNLIAREIKVRHKQSVLGLTWAALSPLITTTILALVFSGFFGVGLQQGSFGLYVMSGLVLWNLYSAATQTGLSSIFVSGSLIRKVYVPKSVFPLAAVLAQLVNFGFSLLGLFAYMFIGHAQLRPATVLGIIPVLELLILSIGAAMLLSTLYIYFRDIRWFYESALLALFYASPVFYPAQVVSEKFSRYLGLNPFWSILAAFRSAVIYGQAPATGDLLYGGIAAIVALIAGVLVLNRYQYEFICYL